MNSKPFVISMLWVRFGEFTFDIEKTVLLRENGESVRLPPKAFDALAILVQLRGATATKEQLRDALWPDSFVTEANLTQTIFLLRKTLGKAPDGGDYIETIPKRGYRLRVPVEELENKTLTPKSSRKAWIYGISTIALFCFVLLFTLARLRHHYISPDFHVGEITRLTSDGNYKEYLCPLLSAGTDLYFTETIDNRHHLAHWSPSVGQLRRDVIPDPHAVLTAISSDGRQMLFSPVWEMDTSAPVSIQQFSFSPAHSASFINAHGAALSPEGDRIAFARGTRLYVAHTDGSNLHVIAVLPSIPFWPRWSPDGTRIRFSASDGGRNNILFEVSANGGQPHPVFSRRSWHGDECCGEWSHNGSMYAYVVSSAKGSSLWIKGERLSPDQADFAPQEIAPSGPVDFWRSPTFSADDRHLFAAGEQAHGELIRYDNRTRRFEPVFEDISSDTLAFSRDGEWIAWTAYPEGTLWRARRNGTERRQLTQGPAIARFPQWSPDGKSVLYIAANTNENWKIYEVPAAGGIPHALIPGDASDQGVATWSPDGRQIAYAHLVQFGVNGKTKSPILIYDHVSGQVTAIPGSEGLWTVRWSPDGHYIAACTQDNRKLMLYDFASQRWNTLAEVGVNDVVWSPDSRNIFFDSNIEPELYRYNLSSRHLEPYASLKGIRRTGFYGLSINLTPEGDPILLRQAGVNEIYSIALLSHP